MLFWEIRTGVQTTPEGGLQSSWVQGHSVLCKKWRLLRPQPHFLTGFHADRHGTGECCGQGPFKNGGGILAGLIARKVDGLSSCLEH